MNNELSTRSFTVATDNDIKLIREVWNGNLRGPLRKRIKDVLEDVEDRLGDDEHVKFENMVEPVVRMLIESDDIASHRAAELFDFHKQLQKHYSDGGSHDAWDVLNRTMEDWKTFEFALGTREDEKLAKFQDLLQFNTETWLSFK